MKTTAIKAKWYTPKIRSDGSCTECSGGWQCAFHQRQGVELDQRRAEAVRLASQALKRQELERIIMQFELETDEGGTKEAKAQRILDRQTMTTKALIRGVTC